MLFLNFGDCGFSISAYGFCFGLYWKTQMSLPVTGFNPKKLESSKIHTEMFEEFFLNSVLKLIILVIFPHFGSVLELVEDHILIFYNIFLYIFKWFNQSQILVLSS